MAPNRINLYGLVTASEFPWHIRSSAGFRPIPSVKGIPTCFLGPRVFLEAWSTKARDRRFPVLPLPLPRTQIKNLPQTLFLGLGDIHGPKPYKFIGFGDIHGPTPYKFIGFGDCVGVSLAYTILGRVPADPTKLSHNSSGGLIFAATGTAGRSQSF